MTHQIDSLADQLEDRLRHLDQRDSVRVTGIICNYKSVLKVIGGAIVVSRAPEDLDRVERAAIDVESELTDLKGYTDGKQNVVHIGDRPRP